MAILSLSVAPAQPARTLDDCIRIALDHSIALRIAQNQIRQADLSKSENDKTFLPELKLSGKAITAPHSATIGYDNAVTDGGQLSAQIVVEQPVYDGGLRGLRGDQIGSELERLGLEERRTERDIRFAVTSAFIDLLAAAEQLHLEELRTAELSDYASLTQRIFHGGGSGSTDVLKTTVSLETARIALEKARQDQVTARFNLAETMGTPGDTAFSVTGVLDTPADVMIDSLLASMAPDSASNIEVRIAETEYRHSLIDVNIARTEQRPTVNISGDAGYLSSADNLKLPADQRVGGAGFSIGISVDHLLINWGVTSLRAQQKELESENFRLTTVRLRQSLSAELHRLRNQISASRNQIGLLARALSSASDNFILTKAQYAGGTTAALDVLTAEQLLSENRTAELETRAGLHRLLARYRQLSLR